MGKRSNGCITCRKRKVKCDESKPTCLRCNRATYCCAGYDQPWLDEAPYIALAQQRASQREKEYKESGISLLPSDSVLAGGYLPAESIAQPMDLAAFQEDICRSFVFHRLSGAQYSKAMSWWLSPNPRVEVQSRTLVSASKAMSAAFFGRINRQRKIIIEGDLMYGEALRNLSLDLSHQVKAFTFETLGATLALNMYELVHMAPGSPTWITHAGGIGKLLEARGPEQQKTYPEKSIFVELRMLLVAEGIFACRRTFLDEQRWKDVPWEDDLPAKTPCDYLVDILSDIPCFLQQVTYGPISCTNLFPESQMDRIGLQKQLLERLETVKELRKGWNIKYSGPLWQIPPKNTSLAMREGRSSLDLVEPPFQTVLYFTDLSRVNDFLIYNTTLILLIMLYEAVSYDIEPSLSYPSTTLQTLFPKITLQSLACDICRCTEYLLLDIHGARGYIILNFPATVAYFAIDKETAEAKWLHDVCKRNAERSGFGFADNALDRATPLSIWMSDCEKRRQSILRC